MGFYVTEDNSASEKHMSDQLVNNIMNRSDIYPPCFPSNATHCEPNNKSGMRIFQPFPFILQMDDFSVTVSGYLSTALVIFTVLTNCLVCIVLLKRHMRNPTNALLVALAVSTTLTGVCPTPCYIYFYILGHYMDWVPHSWCFAYFILTDHLPTIFHTASIWLTVALAVQRYLTVCQSLDTSKRWCTVKNVVRVVIVIHIVAFACQCCRFFESTYTPFEFPSVIDPTKNITGCSVKLVSVVAENENVFFGVYYCFRVIFIHILPCFALVLLNSFLVGAMQSAQKRRKQLLRQNRRSECRRLAESNATTWMLVTVVGVFLLVELPLAILFIFLVIDNTFEMTFFNPDSTNLASVIINLLILFSYPINFFIYCGMSKQFRETFKGLFMPSSSSSSTSLSLASFSRRNPSLAEQETRIFPEAATIELTQL